MQVRLSWRILAAILIFLIAACLLGRSLMIALLGPGAPPPAAASPLPERASPTRAAMDAPTASPSRPPTPEASPAAAAPTASETPAPTASETPAPTASETPAPTASETPAPTASETPAPTASETPAPSPSATPAPAPLRLIAAGFAQPADVMAYAFTVSNPNQGLMVRDTRYQLVVYDAGGIVIKTDTGTIGPVGPGGQSGVAAFLNLLDGLRAARIDVVLGSGLFLQPADSPPVTTANLAFVSGEKPLVTGLLRNPYSQDLEDLPVAAILYGADGLIIGGGSATVPFIPAGGQAAAEVAVLAAGSPARVELYPRLDALLAP